MINESFSQRRWNNDMVFSRDAYSSEVFHSSSYDNDFILRPPDTRSSSRSPSVSSSDGGDDDFQLDFGGVDGNIFNWSDSNLLDTSLTELVEGNLSDWVVAEVTNAICSTSSAPNPGNTVEISSEPQVSTSQEKMQEQLRRRKSRKTTMGPFRSKKWSSLNEAQKLKLLDELSQVISTEMGLREQLDIIRIIDPTAVVRRKDKEFAIDLNCLNDVNWQAVCKSVKEHKRNQTHSNSRNNSDNTNDRNLTAASHMRTQSRKTARGARNGGKGKLGDLSGSRGSSKSNAKQLKKENRQQAKYLRGEERKRYRQMMKEQRSGLFVQEQILSVSSSSSRQPEEEDVDILY